MSRSLEVDGNCGRIVEAGLRHEARCVGGSVGYHRQRSLSCATGFCDEESGLCVPRVAVGEACEAGQCERDGFCVDGICQAFDDEGCGPD